MKLPFIWWKPFAKAGWAALFTLISLLLTQFQEIANANPKMLWTGIVIAALFALKNLVTPHVENTSK